MEGVEDRLPTGISVGSIIVGAGVRVAQGRNAQVIQVLFSSWPTSSEARRQGSLSDASLEDEPPKVQGRVEKEGAWFWREK